MTRLEHAVVAAGEMLSGTEFGEQARLYHPGRRGAMGADGSLEDRDPLVQFEVGHGPLITRTKRAVEMAGHFGVDLDGSKEAQDYLGWVGQSQLAIKRLAQRCWRPISSVARNAIFDEDDLGPLVSWYFPDSRRDDYGPSLRFCGLDSPDVADAWNAVAGALHTTACHQAAAAAAEKLDGGLRAPARARWKQIAEALDDTAQLHLTMGEVHERWREIVGGGYEDAEPELLQAALAIRRLNELTNLILAAVMGIVETDDGLAGLDAPLEAVRASGLSTRTLVSVTLRTAETPWMGAPPQPFVVTAGLPVDGLYLSRGSFVQLGSGLTDPYLDLTGQRLGALEELSPT